MACENSSLLLATVVDQAGRIIKQINMEPVVNFEDEVDSRCVPWYAPRTRFGTQHERADESSDGRIDPEIFPAAPSGDRQSGVTKSLASPKYATRRTELYLTETAVTLKTKRQEGGCPNVEKMSFA